MKQINSLLIANRGEIAVRIIRTCKKMGIRAIAVFSDVDKDSLFVKLADEGYALGGNTPQESYLNVSKILEAAQTTGADAIHPGYGFLSENADFVERCEQANIIFVGPHSQAVRAMGSKIQARILMAKHNVPVAPGYNGESQDIEILKKEAQQIGFPVLLKASAGGGGKGMRIVSNENELHEAILSAKREALSAFGDDSLLIEKYFATSRHIEFQIFGDKHGNVIHIFERECTIQRRHQKVLEESPSPALLAHTQHKMAAAALTVANTLRYDNAGTVEFLLDEKGNFYFLEVNTRLQVEHPVTEMVTGLDLVQMQIESAMGVPLQVSQDELTQTGYAIECRLYAENAQNNFLPVSGTIHLWESPQIDGLRVDTGVETGANISIFYDPMIAKVIAYGNTREAAFFRLRSALQKTTILGITTNREFLLNLLKNEDVIKGNYDTHFIQKNSANLLQTSENNVQAIQTMALAANVMLWSMRKNDPNRAIKHVPTGWRNNFFANQFQVFQLENEDKITVYYRSMNDEYLDCQINDVKFKVQCISYDKEILVVQIDNIRKKFHYAIDNKKIHLFSPTEGNCTLTKLCRFPDIASEQNQGGYIANMPGQVIKIFVKTGDVIKNGEALLIIMSMKMENTVYAHSDGEIKDIFVTEGGFVEAGSKLLTIE